jgi:fructoselysine 6-kinase
MRVCGLGDNTVDEYVNQGVGFPGGNAVNVAVVAKSLGAVAAYLGVCGNDERGAFLLRHLEERGIDISRVRVVDGPNSYCEVALEPDGNRRFIFFQPEPQPLILAVDDIDYLGSFDLVHCGYAARLGFDLAELAGRCQLSYDFGERPSSVDPSLIRSLRAASFSRSSFSEAEAIAFARAVGAEGPEIVVVTRGAKGAVVGLGSEIHVQPSDPGRVADTLGAGDAFFAALVVAVYDGESLSRAAERAAHIAAATCERYGAFGTGRPIAVGTAVS